MADGKIRLGDPITTKFFGQVAQGRLVEGPWSEALSEVGGRPLRLVQANGAGGGVDRGADGSVSLISRASLARLAREAGGAPR